MRRTWKNLQRRGPPPGGVSNTTATLAELLRQRPAGLAVNLWPVGRRQEGSCGGPSIPYNELRPHLPGSCQGWGDGWSAFLTPAMPAVVEQLALQIKRLGKVYLLCHRLSNGDSRIGLLAYAAVGRPGGAASRRGLQPPAASLWGRIVRRAHEGAQGGFAHFDHRVLGQRGQAFLRVVYIRCAQPGQPPQCSRCCRALFGGGRGQRGQHLRGKLCQSEVADKPHQAGAAARVAQQRQRDSTVTRLPCRVVRQPGLGDGHFWREAAGAFYEWLKPDGQF